VERSQDLLRLQVRCDVYAARHVRKRLAGVLGEDGSSVEDACLIATELVGNAVRHSGCDEEDVLDVRIARNGRRLLISVHDPGLSGNHAVPRDDDEPGGLGLQIVDSLAERWGAERPDGYLVWAELPG